MLQEKLLRNLRVRKYPRDIIRIIGATKHYKRAAAIHRTKKRMYGDRLLPFRTTYHKYDHTLDRIFRRRWETMYNDKYLFTLFPNPPKTMYKNNKSLKAILSAKRKKFQKIPNN